MPARGKARQGQGDAHGVRVREVARRSQGQAAEQLHAAPEADSNLCTGHFAQTTRSSCAQKPPRFAGLLVVSGRPLRSVSTAEGPLRRAESASASVDASGPSFSSLKLYAQKRATSSRSQIPPSAEPCPKGPREQHNASARPLLQHPELQPGSSSPHTDPQAHASSAMYTNVSWSRRWQPSGAGLAKRPSTGGDATGTATGPAAPPALAPQVLAPPAAPPGPPRRSQTSAPAWKFPSIDRQRNHHPLQPQPADVGAHRGLEPD